MFRSWSSLIPLHPYPAPPGPRAFRGQLSVLTTTLGFRVPFLLESPPEITVPCQAVLLDSVLLRKLAPCPLALAPRGILTFAHPNSALEDTPGWWVLVFATLAVPAGHWPSNFSGRCQSPTPKLRGHRLHCKNHSDGLAALSYRWGGARH